MKVGTILMSAILISVLGATVGSSDTPSGEAKSQILRIESATPPTEVRFRGSLALVDGSGQLLTLDAATPFERRLPEGLVLLVARSSANNSHITAKIVETTADGEIVTSSATGPGVILSEELIANSSFKVARTF